MAKPNSVFWNVKDNSKYVNYQIRVGKYHHYKNIAYGLQYLEFLDGCLKESMHSIVMTHTCKTYVVTTASIIEIICVVFLERSGLYKPNMKFYKMIELVSKHRLFGERPLGLYDKLHELRELRNRIHLYIGEKNNHDYNAFGLKEVKIAKKALAKLLVSKEFHPYQANPRELFDFLSFNVDDEL